jgi:hypothetical protein
MGIAAAMAAMTAAQRLDGFFDEGMRKVNGDDLGGNFSRSALGCGERRRARTLASGTARACPLLGDPV